MQEIIEWLNNPNRDYDAGVLLYEKYGNNKTILDLLRKKKRDAGFLMEKLEYNLAKIAAVPEPPVPATAPIAAPEINIAERKFLKQLTEKNIHENDLPVNLRQKLARVKEIVPLLAALHNKLKSATDDASRKKLVEEMESLENEQIEFWAEVDTLKKHEKPAPVSVAQIAAEVEKLTKRKKIVTDNINRARKEIDKGNLTDRKKNYRLASITGWENELKEIDEKIASFK
jgi:hypothetical protein